ncbi:anthranilate synthase component I [Brumimicrobium salinarum]|uniref:Anthranilate synthase component 1 n=1 Tax=Brumimicrobium salinarum TaxID=2058658 RepID=A0A2I0R5G6_9FLAO|nr:anthranilate synthase component I family protein [Brumimicrobium salinarum]PKR81832.1 anthranilate synthase component I [Brumimicrobium salinarum]
MKYKVYTKHKKKLADLYTPVNLYNKLRDHFPNALLLESADYHDRTDSKSFICLSPYAGFEAKGKAYEYKLPHQETKSFVAEEHQSVYTAFQDFIAHFEATTTELPFNTQGLWGFSSFEAVQYMEDIEMNSATHAVKDNPNLKYQFFRYVLVFDHFKNELYITQNETDEKSNFKEGISFVEQLIDINNLPNFSFSTDGDETSTITDAEYKTMVEKGIRHCQLGDTFQLVLSRAFEQKYKGDDFNLYRCLRSINPSPYLFYFDYGDFKIFGASPESQLQVHNGEASINPIAGTILRGDSQSEDKKRAEELKKNPKEMAEHVMLVDLARNDLSKNAAQVKVENYAEIQFFSHVIHMVSKVKGKLLPHQSSIRTFGNTFPAGTLSGAPKYEALSLIQKYEKHKRNFYGGAIGFFGFDGSVNHAIIIRSILSKNNTLVYQAGAGIVSESTPEGELQEVNNKIKAIRKAIQKANEL